MKFILHKYVFAMLPVNWAQAKNMSYHVLSIPNRMDDLRPKLQ